MAAYYDITKVLATGARYIMLLGQRANGKSYQVKETCLKHAYKTSRKFVYLRRWQADIKAKSVEAYFTDMPIKKITKGEFNTISCYAGSIYFANMVDGKVTRGPEIGRYLDLNEQQRYKSQAFPDYDYIIFEEFISTGLYLTDECIEFTSLISTIARNRAITVFLVGNTISRICPYFTEFSLDSSIMKMKPGDLQIYHYHQSDEEDPIDVAVEYCANSGFINKMFATDNQKNNVGSEWDTFKYPAMVDTGLGRDEYENIYSLLLEFNAHKFMMQLIVSNEGDQFVHVYPCTTDKLTERVISNKFNISPMYSIDFNVKCKPILKIKELIDTKKICFSDNLTGTEFYNVLGQMGIA